MGEIVRGSAGFAKDCLPPCEACVNAGTSIEEAANELDASQQQQQHHTHTTTPSSPHLREKYTPNEQQKGCGDAPVQRNPKQACRKTPGQSLLLFWLVFPSCPCLLSRSPLVVRTRAEPREMETGGIGRETVNKRPASGPLPTSTLYTHQIIPHHPPQNAKTQGLKAHTSHQKRGLVFFSGGRSFGEPKPSHPLKRGARSLHVVESAVNFRCAVFPIHFWWCLSYTAMITRLFMPTLCPSLPWFLTHVEGQDALGHARLFPGCGPKLLSPGPTLLPRVKLQGLLGVSFPCPFARLPHPQSTPNQANCMSPRWILSTHPPTRLLRPCRSGQGGQNTCC